jgi:nucleoside-diphosphate-sugar epimerase
VAGSANLDMRSLYLNYELALFCYDANTVAATGQWMDTLLTQCADSQSSDRRLFSLPEEYFRVNVMGTWNVLQAAHEAGVHKAVLASSISASGVGEIRPAFPPRYLPIDEAHACHPTHAYGVSKLVGEQLARSFVDRGGISVICLRPTAVMFPHTRPRFVSRAADPDHPWLAAWVTAADCARAFVLALDYEQADFDVFFITADDCASPMPTLDRLARLFAASPLAARDPGLYERVPQATCVDPTRARERLGWQATTAWSATPGA